MSARVVNDTATGKFMNSFCIPIVPFPEVNLRNAKAAEINFQNRRVDSRDISVPFHHPVADSDFRKDVFRGGGIVFDFTADICHVYTQDLIVVIGVRPPYFFCTYFRQSSVTATNIMIPENTNCRFVSIPSIVSE